MSQTSFPKKFNLDFQDQLGYLEGYHRSGWPFVMRYLYKLHDPNATTLLDTYVDRTFHWNRPNFIPYTQAWVGIVHHTFDTSFSTYNNVNLLKNPLFLQSLPYCKGLYVFSQSQAQKMRDELAKVNYQSIPVQALVHPTEDNPDKFTMAKFFNNPNKKLVQIGAWLRDNYSIFRLNHGKSTIDLGTYSLNKAALSGPNMDHYYKPNGFFQLFRPPIWKTAEENFPSMVYRSTPFRSGEMQNDVISVNGELPTSVIQEDDAGICRDVICRDSDLFLNKYVVGAIDLLEDYDESVTMIPTLSDEDYDELLAENVVYLKLVDAAAVNTLIECIIRDTPIVINSLPAVVEILGEDYPLYMNSEEELQSVTASDIRSAHTYLQNMEKAVLTGDYFLQTVAGGEIYNNLQ